MELELTDEQQELRDNVRGALERFCPPATVRRMFEGDGAEQAAVAAEVWKQITSLDWPGVAIDEAHGGLGLSFVELALVAEELGRAVAPGPFLATVTQFAPMVQSVGDDAACARFLAPVAAGSLTGTVAFAEGDRWEPAAVRTTASRSGNGWVLSGTKSSVVDGSTAEEIVVIARAEGTSGADGLGVFVVPGADVAATVRPGLDPTIAVADLTLTGVAVPSDRVLAAPGSPEVGARVERAWHQATVALAFATTGACRRLFEETLQYAKDRVQYDRPIGSFQALKHRFADWYLSVERATALCYFAALTIAEDDPRRAEGASLAKAAAGDCQRLSAQEGLQLHGGIGYTWEHDVHFLLKRAKVGDALLGTAITHRARLARLLGLAPEVAA